MTNILIKTLRSSFFILAFSLFLNTTASAQNCATPPTCEQLGYDKNSSNCPANALKCPFDQSKLYCAPGYAAVGDILYSDMSTNPALLASRRPIGIVISSEKRLAVGLVSIGKISQTLNWGPNIDVPGLPNYANRNDSLNDKDGYYNTQTMINYGKENNLSYPIAELCSKYAPQGMTPGKWFLPSAGELRLLSEISGAIATAVELTKAEILNYGVSSTEANAGGIFTGGGAFLPDIIFSKNGMLAGVSIPTPIVPMIHF